MAEKDQALESITLGHTPFERKGSKDQPRCPCLIYLFAFIPDISREPVATDLFPHHDIFAGEPASGRLQQHRFLGPRSLGITSSMIYELLSVFKTAEDLHAT
jgi:hypothetical protein